MNAKAFIHDYLFDLQGYLVLTGALSAEEVETVNATADRLLPIQAGEWRGNVHCQSHDGARGINLQNITEGGAAFESLIDHPSWFPLVERFVDATHGLFIDEAFYNVRSSGQSINIHSGGHDRRTRTQFRYHNQQFFCGQINILIALTDIGPGDGATMVIPGSHKSNLPHPAYDTAYRELVGTSMDGMLAAEEVFLQAGDALLFVDCLCHGSSARTNPGERRIVVYRYGPGWGHSRFGYQPSPELLDRLSERQRQIMQPTAPLLPPGRESTFSSQ